VTFATRLWISAVSVLAAIALLTVAEGLLALFIARTEALDIQSRTVVRAAATLTVDLQDAESAQRGFLLVENDHYLASYETARLRFGADLQRLEQAAHNTPEVESLIGPLGNVVNDKFAELAETIRLERAGRRASALALVQTGRGAADMTSARELLGSIQTVESRLRVEREATAKQLQLVVFWLLMIGGPAVTALVLVLTWFSVRKLHSSFDWLRDRIHAIRSGASNGGALPLGDEELKGIAGEFDALASELRLERERRSRTEDDLRRTNDELSARHIALSDRAETSELRRRLANRLSGCLTLPECIEVIRQLLPSAVRNVPGAFFMYDNSRRFLSMVMQWNGAAVRAEEFQPDDCWAVRRGQPHRVVDARRDVVCPHVGDATNGYTCTPLAAQGETLGMLYLQSARDEDVGEDELQILAEMLAISLANVRLRESLQTASLRDPLTGLFNRRYLQEAWDLESARATRSGRTLAVLMIDIDHFKRFNDSFGHDAGDQILKSVADVLRSGTRTGDVVCRFGGEEFVVVLVDADDQSALARAETLRKAVKEIQLSYGPQQLGTVTISIGVATFPLVGSSFDEVQQAADAALYRAKASGRNRVEVTVLAPAGAALD
jgi:diguanylate cyclase (GGDEF)-like protein